MAQPFRHPAGSAVFRPDFRNDPAGPQAGKSVGHAGARPFRGQSPAPVGLGQYIRDAHVALVTDRLDKRPHGPHNPAGRLLHGDIIAGLPRRVPAAVFRYPRPHLVVGKGVLPGGHDLRILQENAQAVKVVLRHGTKAQTLRFHYPVHIVPPAGLTPRCGPPAPRRGFSAGG